MITPSKEFWEVFKNTDGALSCTEAVAIMNIAIEAPDGNYLEMGSYHGKSAMSALYSLKSNGRFQLLEPEFISILFASKAKEYIEKAQKICKSKVIVMYSASYSIDFLQKTNDIYSFVFSDAGNHQGGLPMQEVKLLEDRMVQGGIIVFHDFNSQFKEVKEAGDYLVGTGKYEYIPINWDEIIQYVNENNLEDGNKSWHHNELKNPCFVGAVKRK